MPQSWLAEQIPKLNVWPAELVTSAGKFIKGVKSKAFPVEGSVILHPGLVVVLAGQATDDDQVKK